MASIHRSYQQLAQQTHHYALVNGLLHQNRHTKQIHAIPHTIQSQVDLITREQFNKVQNIQPLLNKLVHDISLNPSFLKTHLEKVVKDDEFTARLLQIYEEQQYKDKIQMGVHRSDYMLHYDSPDQKDAVLQQVELNTISSAFGALSTELTNMHHYYSTGGYKVELSQSKYNISKCMAQGHEVFKERYSQQLKREPIVLFVVQPGEGNFSDQRQYEYQLKRDYEIIAIRKTLTEVAECAKLDENNMLVVDNEYPVSVVYYRAGYGPGDYPSEKEWEARKMLETSLAINCPSIGYQLAGTKKVQQVLADENILKLFVHDQTDLRNLLDTFTGIYSLENPDHVQFIQDAIQNPQAYVLKPEREGGGNLIYGEKMADMLKDNSVGKSQYILMRRICPRGTPTVFVKDGEFEEALGVSELGIFGTHIADSQKVYLSACAGYLLRTKKEGVEDGGVASGVAVMDSIAFSN